MSVLHYDAAMPIKNIVTGQRVAKEKLEGAKEMWRDVWSIVDSYWHKMGSVVG